MKFTLDSYRLNLWDNFKIILTKKYANFYGRGSRDEYVRFIAALAILSIASTFISMLVAFLINPILGLPVIALVNLLLAMAMIVPIFALTLRRLHDTNYSGLYILANCIPIIGTIWFLKMMLSEGTITENAYGNLTSYLKVPISIQRKFNLGPSPDSMSNTKAITIYILSLLIYNSLSILLIQYPCILYLLRMWLFR